MGMKTPKYLSEHPSLPEMLTTAIGIGAVISCEPRNRCYSDREIAEIVGTTIYTVRLRRNEAGIPDSRIRRLPEWQETRKKEGW